MKKLLFVLIVTPFMFSCKQTAVKLRECGNMVCTENFASVNITFVKDGEHIDIKDYSAVNQRTGDTLKVGRPDVLVPGVFVVADDNNLKKLSEKGDDIKVAGTEVGTNITKTAIVKISGGKCACHVEKISGPDEISFD